MELTITPAFDAPEIVRELFEEYTNVLIEGDPAFRDYLSIQNYDREILHLEEKYGPPRGRLYLARWGGETAGCIALRPLDESRCEMKRLYVRPAFRNRGIARKLVDTVLADARSIGYHEMLLDTLPFLTEAIAMYEGLGFVRTECYNDSPLDTTVYMKLTL